MSTDLEYEQVLDAMLATERERLRALKLSHMARNRRSVRWYETEAEANDCVRGYEHHPAPLPADASPAFREGWFDREQWVLG